MDAAACCPALWQAGRRQAGLGGGARYGRYGRAICVKCGLRVGVVPGAYMGKGKEQSGKFIKCHCRFIKTRQKRRTRTTHTHTHTGIICVLCVCVCVIRGMRHMEPREGLFCWSSSYNYALVCYIHHRQLLASFTKAFWPFYGISQQFHFHFGQIHSAQWFKLVQICSKVILN